MADLDDLRSRLESIAEELADAGIDLLRRALEEGRSDRPEAERRVAQARRAVERAVAALNALEATSRGEH
jgi:hypothetical protein